MYNHSIISRVIQIVFLLIVGSVISLFTSLNPVAFGIGVIGYHLVAGIIAHFRFR